MTSTIRLIVMCVHRKSQNVDVQTDAGLEPATFCSEDRCSAIEPASHLLLSNYQF